MVVLCRSRERKRRKSDRDWIRVRGRGCLAGQCDENRMSRPARVRVKGCPDW